MRAKKNRKVLNARSKKWYNEHKDIKYKQRRTPSNRYTMARNTAKSRGQLFQSIFKTIYLFY